MSRRRIGNHGHGRDRQRDAELVQEEVEDAKDHATILRKRAERKAAKKEKKAAGREKRIAREEAICYRMEEERQHLLNGKQEEE